VPSPPRDRRNGVKASVYLTPVSDSEALQKEIEGDSSAVNARAAPAGQAARPST